MIEPVVKEISVPARPEEAFKQFTAGVASWWPRVTHSVSKGKCREVVWEGPAGSMLYEVDEDGERHIWGTFSEFDPPSKFVMSWHPGRNPETAQQIEVTFEARGDETLVTLRQWNFEGLGEDAASIRAQYDGGWLALLGMYRDALA